LVADPAAEAVVANPLAVASGFDLVGVEGIGYFGSGRMCAGVVAAVVVGTLMVFLTVQAGNLRIAVVDVGSAGVKSIAARWVARQDRMY